MPAPPTHHGAPFRDSSTFSYAPAVAEPSPAVPLGPRNGPHPDSLLGRILFSAARLQPRLVAIAAPTASQCVLELACGEGHLTWRLHEAARGAVIHACDTDHDLLHVARLRLGKDQPLSPVPTLATGPGIRLHPGTVLDLPLPLHSVDLAVGWLPLAGHTLVDRLRILNALRRLLTPGGALAVAHFDGPGTWLLPPESLARRFGRPVVRRGGEPDSLDDQLRQAGFTDIVGVARARVPAGAVWLVRAVSP